MAIGTKKDWVLFALALANGRPVSPVQIQKIIFLFDKLFHDAVLPDNFYEFVPDNYGPFCGDIYDDIRRLESEGSVAISKVPKGNYFQYAATSDGIELGLEFGSKLPEAIFNHARNIVRWVLAQSFRSLVTAIYARYPEYKAKSVFTY